MLTGTEPGALNTLEAAVAPSTESEEVSEEPKGEKTEEVSVEAVEEEKEPPKDEKKEEAKADQELETLRKNPKVMSLIQSERDKAVNSYRSTRESDTALIRRLTNENRELKKAQSAKASSSLISSILSEDEDSGKTPEETKTRELALKEFVDKYDKNFTEVEEAAQIVTDLSTKIPAKVVKAYELNDANTSVRATNMAKLVNDAVNYINESTDFLMVIEQFFPKGDEVRKEIDQLVKDLSDPDLATEKAKKLYLADRMRGLKVTPKKKPPAPSGTTGGRDWSKATTEEIVAEGLREAQKNRRK